MDEMGGEQDMDAGDCQVTKNAILWKLLLIFFLDFFNISLFYILTKEGKITVLQHNLLCKQLRELFLFYPM